MDATVLTAVIGLAGTTLAAMGGGLWHAACWFAKKADLLIENHVELTKKLSSEIEWKRDKLETIHEDVREIHQVVVPPIPDRPSTKLAKNRFRMTDEDDDRSASKNEGKK